MKRGWQKWVIAFMLSNNQVSFYGDQVFIITGQDHVLHNKTSNKK